MTEAKLERATEDDFQWLAGEAAGSRGLCVAPDLAPPEVIEIVRGLPANWLVILDGEVAGIIGLKADDGAEVEIGYGMAASRWGRGLATAAVRALMPILRERGVRAVKAETSVDNVASQRVLERNGFERRGERIDDEDGPVHVWGKEI